MAISPKPSDAKMPDDLIDDPNSEHEKEEQEYEEKDRDTTAPTTPEPPAEDGYQGEVDIYQESIQHIRGKKRARRAKGKKKKQKTNLMITNDDGTDSTTQHVEGPPGVPPVKKVYLRPSNNPLLRAPKNSTQFIIDDHENSQHFMSFQDQDGGEVSEDEVNRLSSIEEREAERVMGKDQGDFFDPFQNAYSEKDFDTVYENAHQEQVYSWERTKIMEEIAVLELKQKRLISMLSQIDPVVYLQKLQQELVALQETNRRLKLTNIAERLERNQRGGSRTSSPRLPDSTSGELQSPGTTSATNSSSSSSSSSDDEDLESDVNLGGCSSGCCLASPRPRCDVADMRDVEEEEKDYLPELESKGGEAGTKEGDGLVGENVKDENERADPNGRDELSGGAILELSAGDEAAANPNETTPQDLSNFPKIGSEDCALSVPEEKISSISLPSAAFEQSTSKKVAGDIPEQESGLDNEDVVEEGKISEESCGQSSQL